MNFNIPKYVKNIMERLQKEGYEAYVVGGSIRDMLLGKEPNDYDITTNALPEEVKQIFFDLKTIDIGKKFGTIILVQEKEDVEVTTFRKDGDYIDGRKPEWVSFSRKIEDDLGRRDFTINAIAYNETKGIVDPYGGLEDLKKNRIRTVGSAEERFSEDYIRILRAVRFSTQLGFTIDKETFDAGKKHSGNISKISMERIAEEFLKILLCEKPSNGIRLLNEIGILKIILPEIIPTIGFEQKNPHHTKDVYNHMLCVLDNSPPIIQIRLAAILHDIGKPQTLTVDEEGIGHFYDHHRLGSDMSKEILKRFKVSSELIEKVSMLIKEHMNHHVKFKEKGLKRLIRRLGEKEVFHLIELQKADIKCSAQVSNTDHIIERERKLKEIIEAEEVYEVNKMNINGKDLIELGFEQGAIIGEILEYLLDIVMERADLNCKKRLEEEALKKFAPKIK